MSNNRFDAEGFFAALDGHRQSKKMSWKQVAEKAGISASTLTRMGQGKRPDVDSLSALSSWSGIDVRLFYRPSLDAINQSEPLADITALLRADRNLTDEGAKHLETMIKSVYESMRKNGTET